MDIKLRDDAIARNRLLLRVLLIWSVLSSIALILISTLCFSALRNQKTHWLPICSANEIAIGGSSYSPSYIKEMTAKVLNLRFTYSPSTVGDNYKTLVHLAEPSKQEALKKVLATETYAILKKSISSVFYVSGIKVDVKNHIAIAQGTLQRTLHDISVKPQRKKYIIEYSFHDGLLSPVLIKEIKNEKI